MTPILHDGVIRNRAGATSRGSVGMGRNLIHGRANTAFPHLVEGV